MSVQIGFSVFIQTIHEQLRSFWILQYLYCTEQMFVAFIAMQGCFWKVTQVEQMPSCWSVSHCQSVFPNQQSAKRGCGTRADAYCTGGQSGFLCCVVGEQGLSSSYGCDYQEEWKWGSKRSPEVGKQQLSLWESYQVLKLGNLCKLWLA